jgi:hypothetical protein
MVGNIRASYSEVLASNLNHQTKHTIRIEQRNRKRSGHIRPNKNCPAIGIYEDNKKHSTLEGQVPVRSEAGYIGSLKEATTVP